MPSIEGTVEDKKLFLISS